MRHYVLRGLKPVQVTLDEWVLEETRSEPIQQNYLGGDKEILVSTVFLSVDHSFTEKGPPVLYETMIFGGKYDQYQERYSTLGEAKSGHQEAVELVQASL